MTIEEAKAVIYGNVVYACEKAGFAPQTTRLVQDACDTIIAIADACDTVIALADRKTEPQTCDTCKWGEWYRKGYDITMMDDECGGCCSWNSKWTPKTEPTGYNLSPVEDEPQTECTGSPIGDYRDGVGAWQTERSE